MAETLTVSIDEDVTLTLPAGSQVLRGSAFSDRPGDYLRAALPDGRALSVRLLDATPAAGGGRETAALRGTEQNPLVIYGEGPERPDTYGLILSFAFGNTRAAATVGDGPIPEAPEPEPQTPELRILVDGEFYRVRPRRDISPYEAAMLSLFLWWEDEALAVNVAGWLAEHGLWRHLEPAKENGE